MHNVPSPPMNDLKLDDNLCISGTGINVIQMKSSIVRFNVHSVKMILSNH